MPRMKSQIAAAAVTIAVAIGTRAHAASCASLLTANDASAVIGMPMHGENTGVDNQCMFTTDSTAFEGEHPTVTLIVQGGRAEYDQSVSMGKQYGMPTTPLSGIGDKAYENNNCGEQCAEVGAMKGKTYFMVMVQEDVNHSRSAAALARQVAERIK